MSDLLKVTYSDIVKTFQVTLERSERIQNACALVKKRVKIHDDRVEMLEERISNLENNFKKRWQKAGRIKERFLTLNKSWLETEFDVNLLLKPKSKSSTVVRRDAGTTSSGVQRGRPKKEFENLSERSKRRLVATESTVDCDSDPIEKVLLAAKRAAYIRQEHTLVKVMGYVIRNRENAARMMTQLSCKTDLMSKEEALAFFIDNSFSKAQYSNIQKESPARFPSYYHISQWKKECSPAEESIIISPSKVTVQLQALMQHTSQRIIEVEKEEISKYLDSNNLDFIKMTLLSSWGLDGTSNQSQYHQKGKSNDSNLVATVTTPIRLSHSDASQVFWVNPTPQSVRFCRPIILEFAKETYEFVRRTKKNVEDEISGLVNVKINLTDNKFVLIDFTFVMSMIDGKVLTYVIGSKSMSRCPICKATPNKMSSLKMLNKGFSPINEEALIYGVSPLHCWIRFFEFLLHVSYRMEIKISWKRMSPEQHDLVNIRKQMIKKRLYEAFDVKVDMPRAGGSGTSTTGNLCRRVFSNPAKMSEALEVDEEIIIRFVNILISINCHEQLDPEKLQNYCTDTYKKTLEKYSWYKIPSSVHKVLAHAGAIILHSPAPLGVLGEEGAESRNKLYRHDRQFHARKTSREDNISDVFSRAMMSSDPLISTVSLYKRQKAKRKLCLPDVVKDFLVTKEETIESDLENYEEIDVLGDIMDKLDHLDDDWKADDEPDENDSDSETEEN
ncbi:uncharacterized protein DMENIID0001_023290 [Sergentomyia squamirostris]